MTYKDREKRWVDIISHSDQTVFVAEDIKDEIIGFFSGGNERTGKYPQYPGELYAIYILAEHQRKEIGRQLVNPIVESLKQKNISAMVVFVLEDNKSCLFYEHFGARKIDTVEIGISGKN